MVRHSIPYETKTTVKSIPASKKILQAALSAAAEETIKQVRNALNKVAKDDDDDDKKRGENIASGLTLSDLSDISSIGDELAEVASDGGNSWIADVGLPDNDLMFNRVNERAVRYAAERSAELVSGIDDATRDEMRGLITQGLIDNVGVDGISDLIKEAYAFSEKRADLIANTEVARANMQGALNGMHEARDSGITVKKIWLSDEDACDECEDNGADGAIELEENFSSGDDSPPAHPNCRCNMASETDLEEK